MASDRVPPVLLVQNVASAKDVTVFMKVSTEGLNSAFHVGIPSKRLQGGSCQSAPAIPS